MLETTISQLGFFSLGAISFMTGLGGIGLLVAVLRERRLHRIDVAIARRYRIAWHLDVADPDDMPRPTRPRLNPTLKSRLTRYQPPIPDRPAEPALIKITPDDVRETPPAVSAVKKIAQ